MASGSGSGGNNGRRNAPINWGNDPDDDVCDDDLMDADQDLSNYVHKYRHEQEQSLKKTQGSLYLPSANSTESNKKGGRGGEPAGGTAGPVGAQASNDKRCDNLYKEILAKMRTIFHMAN
ncbi:uncharacterized protein LOC128866365 [Anastrepha ludens]|uniref:uncharacterized protein LOC128866365 n=1 Tax=Anastrepha ludens TaxID=28586 RepID=UPI0023B19773|nr:uncharacterized protein LOC128866365 [Anastrepha ludens]